MELSIIFWVVIARATYIDKVIHQAYVAESSLCDPFGIFRFLYGMNGHGVRDCLNQTGITTCDQYPEAMTGEMCIR